MNLTHWTLIYKAIREVEELSRYEVSSNGFKLENRGICSSMTETLAKLSLSAPEAPEETDASWATREEFFAWMKSVLPLWPSFSGDLDYPVEGGSQEYLCNHKWSGMYSKKRKELLAWLIEKLEAMPVEE